jgi:hypothetical protein
VDDPVITDSTLHQQFGKNVVLLYFFERALKDAGVDLQLAHNIMLQFGDLVKANEDNLRRELSRIP